MRTHNFSGIPVFLHKVYVFMTLFYDLTSRRCFTAYLIFYMVFVGSKLYK